jgi:hypothetical protein
MSQVQHDARDVMEQWIFILGRGRSSNEKEKFAELHHYRYVFQFQI